MVKKGQIETTSVIDFISARLKKEYQNESTGHDWYHLERVWKMAKKIAQKEGKQINMLVLELAALLHDELDFKFSRGQEEKKKKKLIEELKQHQLPEKDIDQILTIIKQVSFKGAGVADKIKSLEGKIVQDADRLDALGAIGIARTFAYGGYSHIPIYDPANPPIFYKDFQSYRKKKSTTINHFYEKLLLLPDRLHTKTAKRLGQKRIKIMKDFLKHFYKEWELRDFSSFKTT